MTALLLLFVSYFIHQCANLFDPDPDVASVLEDYFRFSKEANSRWGTREKDRSSFDGGALRQIANLFGDLEDHIPAIRWLIL